MKEIALKPELLEVLKTIDTLTFTVDALTETYLQQPSSLHTSKKAARQFVYRNMQRLMTAGLMERVKVDGQWPQYCLTEQFTRLHICQPVETPSQVEAQMSIALDPLAGLKERLKVHQADILTAMGEMEEYEAICKELPDLRAIAQPRYNDSRERCSRLLGRVKALESLLAADAG